MSTFKVLLSTSTNLKKYLKREIIEIIGKKPNYVQGFNQLEVYLTQEQFVKLLLLSKTLEGGKIQIGKEFSARGPKELEKHFEQQPFAAYIDYQTQLNPALLDPRLINIKSKIYQNQFLAMNRVEEQIRKNLMLIPIRMQFQKVKGLLKRQATSPTLEQQKLITKELKEEQKELQRKRDKLKNTLSKQEEIKRIQNENQELTLYNQDETQLKEIPKKNKKVKLITKNSFEVMEIPDVDPLINLDIQVNSIKARVCIPISREPLFKHGFRQQQSFGTLKETIIGSAFYAIDLKKTLSENPNINFYDPFCGSGTIMLELIQYVLKTPVRKDITKLDIFNKSKIFKIDQVQEQIKEMLKANNQFKNKFYASDISSSTVSKCFNNIRSLESAFNINNYFDKTNSNDIQIPPNVFQQNVANNINIFQSDFEKGFQFLKDQLDQSVIITNIPYGIQSKKHSTQDIKIVYRRFSKVLTQNINKLKDVYIFCNMKPKNQQEKTYLQLCNLIWDIREEFDNGGIKIGLYQLNIEESILQIEKSKGELRLIEKGILKEIPNQIDNEIQQYTDSKRNQLSKYEQRQLNLAYEKKQFLKRWGKSKFLEKTIKKQYKSFHLKKAVLRRIIHTRRKQLVLKIKKVHYLQRKQFAQQKQLQILQDRSDKKRLTNSRRLMRTILRQNQHLSTEEHNQMMASIQESIDKKGEQKQRFLEQSQQKLEKQRTKYDIKRRWY